MDRNPYAPPVSPVADPTEVKGERPKEVTLAVRFLWLSVALGAVGMLMRQLKPSAPAQMFEWLIAAGVVFAIWAWIVTKIARGRNWARILFIVLAIVGLIVAAVSLPFTIQVYTAEPLTGILSLVQLILEAATLYLLLTAPARAWFKQSHEVPPGTNSLTLPPSST
jgi:hypothetical protein